MTIDYLANMTSWQLETLYIIWYVLSYHALSRYDKNDWEDELNFGLVNVVLILNVRLVTERLQHYHLGGPSERVRYSIEKTHLLRLLKGNKSSHSVQMRSEASIEKRHVTTLLSLIRVLRISWKVFLPATWPFLIRYTYKYFAKNFLCKKIQFVKIFSLHSDLFPIWYWGFNAELNFDKRHLSTPLVSKVLPLIFSFSIDTIQRFPIARGAMRSMYNRMLYPKYYK